jgi:stage II sporulation protein D
VRAAEARDVYVRLSAGASKITLASDANMTLVDASKKKHSLGKSAVLVKSGSHAAVGKSRYALPVRVVSDKGGLLKYGGRSYRGAMLLDKSFALVNVLGLEDYVKGVLPAEIGSLRSWEYLRVQAIISRTYVLRRSMSRSSRGYDVVDTASDQVYRGAGSETALTNRAVDDTAGEVVTYGGDLAFTPFHSDSGGHTADNAHVWGSRVPYLRGVRELAEYKSPNHEWTFKLTPAQARSVLSKLKLNVGDVKEIKVSEVDAGGRAVSLTFRGANGKSAAVDADSLRNAVGVNLMKSTMLINGAVKTSKAAPQTTKSTATVLPTLTAPSDDDTLSQMTSEGIFTTYELMDMLRNPDSKKNYLAIGLQRRASKAKASKKADVPALSEFSAPKAAKASKEKTASVRKTGVEAGYVIPFENGAFVFRGSGWGHGVGLSQWGAMALAEQGWKAEAILGHYYPGAKVKKIK